MWKQIKSTAIEEPKKLDFSNPTTIYVRKNIKKVKHTDDNGTEMEIWKYQEQIIPKKDWAYYKELFGVEDSVAENSDGIFDVADLADENSNGIFDLAKYVSDLEKRIEKLERSVQET